MVGTTASLNVTSNYTLTRTSSISLAFHLPLWLFSIWIILGNAVTILVATRHPLMKTRLMFTFMANLAAADLVTGLSVPLSMILLAFDSTLDQFIPCMLCLTAAILPMQVSIDSLFLIAVDRYVAIAHPLHYCTLLSTKRVRLLLASAWVHGLVTSLLPIWWNQYAPVEGNQCTKRFLTPGYKLVTTSQCLLLCLLVGLLYGRVFTLAQRQIKRISNDYGYFNNSGTPQWQSNQRIEKDKKAAKLLSLTLGIFVACWTPFLVIWAYAGVHEDNIIAGAASSYLFLPAYANSGMNILVYAVKNKEFRKAVGDLVPLKSPQVGHTLRSRNSVDQFQFPPRLVGNTSIEHLFAPTPSHTPWPSYNLSLGLNSALGACVLTDLHRNME